jgi:Activator of Hsp90 ATPase homolog 1-like protein
VTVTFQPSSTSTLVEINQVGLPDEEAKSAHHAGWSDALRELDHIMRDGTIDR